MQVNTTPMPSGEKRCARSKCGDPEQDGETVLRDRNMVTFKQRLSESDNSYITAAKDRFHGNQKRYPFQKMEEIAMLMAENNRLNRAYAELLEREQEYHNFFESTRDAIVILDHELQLIEANPAAVRLLGYPSGSAMKSIPIERIFAETGILDHLLKTLLKTGKIENLETTLCPKEKDQRCPVVIGSGFIHMDAKGEPRHFEFVFTDITERIDAERALRENEALYRSIYNRMKIGVARVSLDFRILNANRAYCRMLGYEEEELVGRSIADFTHPDSLQENLRKQNQLLKGEINHYNMKKHFIHKEGHVVYGLLDASLIRDSGGNPSSFLGCVADITEHKRLEAHLLQTQKFEAIGTLASGVAHDFNNLLMGIQGRTSLIGLDLPPAHPHLEHTDAIESHIQSAKTLTDQLLGFARGGKYLVKPIDINDLVRTSAAMFGRTKKGLRIHFKSEQNSAVVEVDQNQIEQVLLNMLINAWQAMPNGGLILLTTETVVPERSFCGLHGIEPGPFVRIDITDTGIGMDKDTRKRIFDPFFTTKERGRGTGLGLASAYGIIKNHGGVVAVRSKPGCGTSFSIFLPASEKEPPPEVQREARPDRGSGKILLVDDEDLVSDVAQAILEKLGYEVVVAKGGRQAVRAVDAMSHDIDLVILDMIMPDMDGEKTFELIREIAPEIPVIFSSGHTVSEKIDRLTRADPSCGFIQKPYSMATLSEHIHLVLDGESEPTGFVR